MDFPLGVNSDFLAPVLGSVSSVRIRKALMAHPRLCHFVWGGSFLGVGFFWGNFWCRADFWVFSAPILFEVARDWETVHEIYCNTHILSWAVFEINLLFLPPQGRLKVFRHGRRGWSLRPCVSSGGELQEDERMRYQQICTSSTTLPQKRWVML